MTAICPACKGAKKLRAHINRGHLGCEWGMVNCPDCSGTGGVPDDFAIVRARAREMAQRRIDRDESLYECAKKHGLSSAELSGIEHGRGDLTRHPYYTKEQP